MAAALSLFKACFQHDANCWEHGSYSTVSLGEGSTTGIFYLLVISWLFSTWGAEEESFGSWSKWLKF